jgi:signal transduction histidine kinase
VIISRVRYGHKEDYFVSAQQSMIKSSYKDAVEIELSPVNFIGEKENKILYQLSGWDDEWKELSIGSTVRYEQLPPGDYTFVTKSVNAAGMDSTETKMGFTVVPPFYLSWWFIAVAVFLLAGILYVTYRFRLHKALEMEKMRTRIATDLHDDIGATLSSISFYSEAVKQKAKEKLPEVTHTLEKMGEISRTMVTGMSDIVWAINPLHDDMEKMQQRMKMYAAELCAVKNLVLHVDADAMIKNLKPGLEQRKNIYMIFKEALNNSLKYAQCKNIWLSLKQVNHRFVMQIRDDGIGFDTSSEQAGNGLQNMKRRAAEIGGSLIIESGKGEGAMIELSVKIT